MSQPSEAVVLHDLNNGVLTLTMNRPASLNSANDALLLTLTQMIREAGDTPEVRVVVLTGAGRGFCAGADLSQMAGNQSSPTRFSEHLEHTFNPLIRAIADCPRPVISAVNGVAAGAGASLALAGDIRLWSSAASAVQIFSNIGLVPDSGATWMLPRSVGYARAFELMAFAEKVTPDAALHMGLCEHVFAESNFAADVQAYAERLAARPLTALTLTKQALRQGLNGTLNDALLTEAGLQDVAGQSWEHREGVTAFLQKRAADFLTPKKPQ
ncbi:enoyl-CoA hydratase-related protein [Deinococcus sp. KNUC1210]|uniref:enoyl-CoA hydratase/isomerase family protein n=1 Tax=Deinococcus sp. KNUC1210 TaxID=2917691 RepID=UPI001EF13A71|nr:enoyl-CoA hydratase-related protein [Deinococcus sp. KNUC1210]ULH14633.1 enoyl-CoA hydratase-related protein [Deinococcus sp. KNUC1210]